MHINDSLCSPERLRPSDRAKAPSCGSFVSPSYKGSDPLSLPLWKGIVSLLTSVPSVNVILYWTAALLRKLMSAGSATLKTSGSARAAVRNPPQPSLGVPPVFL